MHLKVNDTKLNTTDTSNTKSNFEIWFQNKIANKTNSDSKKEEDSDKDKSDIEIEMPKIEQAVSPIVYNKKVKQNKKKRR